MYWQIEALNRMRAGSNLSTLSFIGGGFGLKGAATGMAVALELNALVGAYYDSK